MSDLSNHWGEHLSLDCKGGNEKIRDEKAIVDFFDYLVRAINMEFWDDERNRLCVHFGKDNKAGYTYSALITTSNICGHFCDDGDAYIDVFSCKSIDSDLVIKLLKTYFEFSSVKSKFWRRGEWD
jgi:S-adenosylmethionine/arginine decarboxylase-like enzyme